MLRIFTSLIIIAAIIRFYFAIKKTKKDTGVLKRFFEIFKDSFRSMNKGGSLKFNDVVNTLKIFSYFIAVICTILLTITGFIPYLITGELISGIFLLIHLTAAPVFAVSMTIICIIFAHENLFKRGDLKMIKLLLWRNKPGNDYSEIQTSLRISFWALIFLTPLLMGSIILSMYPFLGTGIQKSLLSLHFTTALLFLVVSLFHTYLLILKNGTDRVKK